MSTAPYVKCLVFSKKVNLKTFLYNSFDSCTDYSSPLKFRISTLNFDKGFVQHTHVSGLFCYNGIFKTLSNICDGIFLQIELIVFSCFFPQKITSQMF